MLFDVAELDTYTKKHTAFDENLIYELPFEVIEQAAKFQVEFYFGQTNYYKDEYLRKCENHEGWIDLKVIYSFRKIRKFHSRLTIAQLASVLELSTVVDVRGTDKFGDGSPILFDLRKKQLVFNSEYKDFFGYDIETIKMLSRYQFETFLRHKKTFED